MMSKGKYTTNISAENLDFLSGCPDREWLERKTKVGLYFVIVEKGLFSVDVDGVVYCLKCGQLLVLRGSTMEIAKLEWSDDCLCHIIFMTMNKVYETFENHDIKKEVTIALSKTTVLNLKHETVRNISMAFELVKATDGFMGEGICRTSSLWLMAQWMMYVLQYDVFSSRTQVTLSESQPLKIFSQFRMLLDKTIDERQPISFYADKLCVSPKYLSAICRKVAGVSALSIITEATVERVRYLLRSSDMSISEISDMMHFTSISYFGQFVRSHLGMSPRDYRKSKES